MTVLSDGVVTLRPMTQDDAEAHLACEDEPTARFLSGGVSTLDGVRAWIAENEASWAELGPLRLFAIDVEAALVGMIEARLEPQSLLPGTANISYGLHPDHRGRGYASRAVRLVVDYLQEHTDTRVAVIQVEPENTSSLPVPERCGFRHVGGRINPDGKRMEMFVRRLGD